MGVGDQSDALAALPPGKGASTYCKAGSVGPKTGLNGCGTSHPSTEIRSSDRPARQRVAVLWKCTKKIVANKKNVTLKFNVGYVTRTYLS
jgi:hypothetical protein